LSNHLGEYRVFDVSPGRYFVQANASENVDGDSSSTATTYASTYYPGTPDSSGASTVTAVQIGGLTKWRRSESVGPVKG
jgi:hypothetical protein